MSKIEDESIDEVIEDLLTPAHKVIVMFLLKAPHVVSTYKAYTIENFLEMSKKENDMPIIRGYLDGKEIDTRRIKTLSDLRRHFIPPTDLTGQISIFDLL